MVFLLEFLINKELKALNVLFLPVKYISNSIFLLVVKAITLLSDFVLTHLR